MVLRLASATTDGILVQNKFLMCLHEPLREIMKRPHDHAFVTIHKSTCFDLSFGYCF